MSKAAFNIHFILVKVIFVISFYFVLACNGAYALSLSEEEKVWIASNPIVEVGIDGDWPPFDFINDDGSHSGISAEYLAELSRLTGLKFDIQADTWSNTLQKLKDGDIDIVTSTLITAQRQSEMLFTSPILKLDTVVIVRKDSTDIESIQDMKDKIISIIADSYTLQWLSDDELDLTLTENEREALRAVSIGDADVHLGVLPVVNYFIEQEQLNNLKISAVFSTEKQSLAIAVNKEKKILHGILEKALAALPNTTHRKIRQRWANLPSDNIRIVDPYLKLSEAEQNWLKHHPNLRLGVDPSWAPIEFIHKNNGYQGITAEYMDRLSKQLNVSMQAIDIPNWAHVLEKARQKQIDVIPALVPSAERAKYLNFTQPYLSFPIVVFVRDDHGLITDITEIKSGLIAIEKSYITEEYMRRDFPELELLLVNNNEEGLQAVANGKAIAYIGSLASGSYIIEKHGLNNIRVAAPTPYRHELAMGVRKDWPELIPILQKALDNISAEAQRSIRKKWFPVVHEKPIDYSILWYLVCTAAFIYALGFLWHLKTRQQKKQLEIIVQERTHKLTEEIEERKQIESQLRYLANYDMLTNLPNRTLFREHLIQSIKQTERHKDSVALLLIDIDGFKNINDSLGHHQGDLLLQIVAERLRDCVRDVDQVARLGGDEFTIILSEVTNKQSAMTVAEKIIHSISKSIKLESSEIYIGASIGITLLPEDTKDASILLGYADMAMYEAKAKGKNSYEFYSSHLSQRVNSRLALEKELHQAIEKNQLQIYYQPIFKTDGGELYGAEALLRWEHPDHGYISPVEFIPVAEDSDLIVNLGNWVLNEAVMNTEKWNKQSNTDFHIAVNISSRQFQKNASCIPALEKCLTEYDIEPRLLNLELTESLMMEEQYEVLDKLNFIKGMGIGLSIDDFGTGYSSLSYIRRFPIDTIKIDKSFVHDITLDTDDAALITAIIAMAKSLDMKVVAEGVETEAQYRFLQDKKCKLVQGYYFSKPLSRRAFEEEFIMK